MKLQVLHQTEFKYDRPVHHSIHELRLTPQNNSNQEVIRWRVNTPAKVFESKDAFGNILHSFVMENNYAELMIEAKGEIETKNDHQVQDSPTAVSPLYLLQNTSLTQPDAAMLDYFTAIKPSNWDVDSLLALTKIIGEKITYCAGTTDAKTTAAQAFALGKGVCQDQAHLMISLCRSQGIPARYVSGYIYDAENPVQASHAWLDICLDIEHAIWTSVDVTNQCLINDCHVRLAIGRDYNHIAPVKGVRFGGGEEQLVTKISIKEC